MRRGVPGSEGGLSGSGWLAGRRWGFSEFTGAADDGHGPVDDLQTDHLYPGGEVFLENIGDAVFEVVQDLLFVVTVQGGSLFRRDRF